MALDTRPRRSRTDVSRRRPAPADHRRRRHRSQATRSSGVSPRGSHRHHLGAISISRGVQTAEIAAALGALAADPNRDGPLGLLPADRLPDWPHLRLYPLSFDRLALAADAPLAAGASGEQAVSRGTELWIGLASAAMAGETATTPTASTTTEPAAVARAIDEHPRAEAYDQVIVGHLLEITRELNEASGAEAEALRRRTGRLIAQLKPETLRRLVEMGGDSAQRTRARPRRHTGHGRGRGARDREGGRRPPAVRLFPDGLLGMLAKLAAHAEAGHEPARSPADGALREQVGRASRPGGSLPIRIQKNTRSASPARRDDGAPGGASIARASTLIRQTRCAWCK